ncbi:MAG: hypothetical protein REI64_05345 [Pedobacter sp.]|uniref:hypothetical protein n=1 Tax=Pedobacter sp. TaxID=1411316 RepID=UPI002809906A|nr:hypothetical protein [Pedobacter sp.]MDQ8004204.1 hypothetical protein [Pedobacter sp.]
MSFKSLIILFLLIYGTNCCAQGSKEEIFSRLQAISNNGTDFFNIDGIEISNAAVSVEFSKKAIAKKFKYYNVKETELLLSDSSIKQQNYYVEKKVEIAPGILQHTTYYFVETSNGINGIAFAGVNKTDKALEKELVPLIINNKIPRSYYESLTVDSVNFVGRKIKLGKNCRWMGVANMQCPYNGQMNWSIHKIAQDAAISVENQYKVIQSKKQGKIVSEEEVNVVFEGSEVKAKRVIYDFKGVTSVLVGMTGGKTLTIYFVVAPVRERFVSCVMSFWNNDQVNPSGLPILLEQVMLLKQ